MRVPHHCTCFYASMNAGDSCLSNNLPIVFNCLVHLPNGSQSTELLCLCIMLAVRKNIICKGKR